MLDTSTQDDSFQQEVQARLVKQLEIPVLANPAIVRCREALNRVCRETLEDLHLDPATGGRLPDDPNEDENDKLTAEERYNELQKGLKDAFKAYREAMPPLSGAQNIRDFIACVAHGMLMDVFSSEEASKLLYAAQVAASAESKRYRSRIG